MQSKVGLLLLLLVVGGGLLLWGWLGDESSELEELTPALGESRFESLNTALHPVVAGSDELELAPSIHSASPSRHVALNNRADVILQVSGIVLDASGAAMGDAAIQIREHEDPEFKIEDYDPFVKQLNPTSAGAFNVQVDRQGEFVLWAVATEHGTSDLVRVKLNPRDPNAQVELRLTQRKTIRGVVLDAEMKPSAGTKVTAFVDVERAGIAMPGGVTSVEYFGVSEVHTAKDGTFEFQTVRSGNEPFTVRAEGRVPRSNELRAADGTLIGPSIIWVSGIAEQSNVAPGDSALNLILQEDHSLNATLRVELSALNGGELPDMLSFTLNEVCPNGGVYAQERTIRSLNVAGEVVIGELRSGRRYELVLERGKVGETQAGTFLALPGENSLRASVPGHFQVTFRFKRGPESLQKELTLRATLITEAGKRESTYGALDSTGAAEVVAKLPVGSFEVEVFGKDGAQWNLANALCRQTVAVSATNQTVDLKLK